MKYGLIAFIIAVLGIGEYAFVEYYPLAPYRREQKVKKLPIVRHIVMNQEKATVEQAFAAESDGILSYKSGNTTYVWRSADEWYADRKNGSRRAAELAERLEWKQQAKEYFSKARTAAKEGAPNGYLSYYMAAKAVGDSTYIIEALEWWKADPSATAQWYYKNWISKDLDMESKEGLLLSAQMAIENVGHLDMPREDYAKQTNRNQRALDWLYLEADSGNENALWAVGQIDTKTVNSSSL